MKWMLTGDDARAIADKLKADRKTSGTRHENVQFRYNGVLIFSFGIRRGSGDHGHNFIPSQMHISQKQCREFRRCTISLDAYINILIEKDLVQNLKS